MAVIGGELTQPAARQPQLTRKLVKYVHVCVCVCVANDMLIIVLLPIEKRKNSSSAKAVVHANVSLHNNVVMVLTQLHRGACRETSEIDHHCITVRF